MDLKKKVFIPGKGTVDACQATLGPGRRGLRDQTRLRGITTVRHEMCVCVCVNPWAKGWWDHHISQPIDLHHMPPATHIPHRPHRAPSRSLSHAPNTMGVSYLSTSPVTSNITSTPPHTAQDNHFSIPGPRHPVQLHSQSIRQPHPQPLQPFSTSTTNP